MEEEREHGPASERHTAVVKGDAYELGGLARAEERTKRRGAPDAIASTDGMRRGGNATKVERAAT